MFFIPGFIISYLSFPGVIAHEAAHMLFCKIRKLAILDVSFFNGDGSGYVVHEQTEDFTSVFLVSVGPLILNTVLCFLFCLPAFIRISTFGRNDPLSYILIWIGVSIGMHAFPSEADASILLDQARIAIKQKKVLAYFSIPLVGIIFIANMLRVIWFDTLYGIAIGVLLPKFLFTHILGAG